MSITGPLVDCFGRLHTDLRVSVTDRCNLRCVYCMRPEGVPFCPHEEVLQFEEIEQFVRVAAALGIRRLRLTGGEPLVRKGICRLVEMLARVPGIDDVAMTTNAVLLPRYAKVLKAAGLARLNISLDTLSRKKFQQITLRDELPRVLEGIAAARSAGFQPIKLNALAIRGQTEEEVGPLARFARREGLQLRFIEFMPLDGHNRWNGDRVLSGGQILKLLREAIGPLEPVCPNGAPGPATEYRFVDGVGRVGLVNSVSRPFCERCSRLRLTAEGQVHNCLFSGREWDARAVLRSGGSRPQAGGIDEQLARLIHAAVQAKKRKRGTDDGEFPQPDRAMHQIGG